MAVPGSQSPPAGARPGRRVMSITSWPLSKCPSRPFSGTPLKRNSLCMDNNNPPAPGRALQPLALAVEVGFEPTEGLPPHTLSRRAPSATRRLHRGRAYPTRPVLPRKRRSGNRPLWPTAAGEEITQQRAAIGGEHAADDLRLVIEAPVTDHIPK